MELPVFEQVGEAVRSLVPAAIGAVQFRAHRGGVKVLGRPDDWRRVSEVWTDANLDEPEMVFEIASRLADYVVHFQPLLPSDAP